jgi:hypothetical protein
MKALLPAGVAAMALALAGCGHDNNHHSTTPGTTVYQTPGTVYQTQPGTVYQTQPGTVVVQPPQAQVVQPNGVPGCQYGETQC